MKKNVSALNTVLGIILLTITCFPSFSQTGTLRAMNDTIDLYPGIPQVYDILANDTIPAGDTIRLVNLTTGNYISCQKIHDSNWKWTFTFNVPQWGSGGEVQGSYRIFTLSMDTSSAKILFRIHDKSFGYLEINNVRARFCASGPHFFFDSSQYEVPKGSGKTSIFSNSLWIGGKDGQGQLHFAGERYRQGPLPGPAGTHPDWYAGPVMDSAKYSVYMDTLWNYVWNLKKSDIDFHKAHFSDPGYTPIHDIVSWPGNGNTAAGQSLILAPFYDVNGDQTYDPFSGDYPIIRGDQALFFIFNDDRGPHLESEGAKLRVEVHGMAYAFDMPEDSAMKNTVFLNYKLFNRSQNTYDSAMLGNFTDIDLGYPNDDYIGCDVERNMYFGYNGTPIDGTGQPYAYGENPPVQSVTLLAGPYMNPDGADNPRFSNTGAQLCDFSVNGLNFGDTIVDNERYGLQGFMYFNNGVSGVPAYMTDPAYAADYYQMLCGKWRDGTTMMYGGNGHAGTGAYGPACRFMFPGESDTLNWGVGCTPPNGPVNWTEETAMNNPQDRRGLGSTGPFTFKPGDVQELDIAFSWARDYGGRSPLSSLAKLRLLTDQINKAFTTNKLSNGNQFYGIGDPGHSSDLLVNVYPNPAADHVNIEFAKSNPPADITIDLLTSQGNSIQRISLAECRNPVRFDIFRLPSGFYYIKVTTKESMTVKKLVIMH
ncbi:MAG: T9SS type A sorting domain-containing protein [Bacteroidetes bacterium]|nr:T9SS type A sorting domain-containing protein [Bacteroidota bacterium]